MATFTVDAKSLTKIERILIRTTQVAKQSNDAALKGVGNIAALETSRKVARQTGAPVRAFRRRIQAFFTEHKKRSYMRVWVGTKTRISKLEAPQAVKRATKGRVFTVHLKSGKTLEVVRRVPGQRWTKRGYQYKGKFFPRPRTSSPNLPIEEPSIRVITVAGPILVKESRKAVRGHYVSIFRKTFKRRIVGKLKSFIPFRGKS